MESFNDIWLAVLDYFRPRVSNTAYTLWINNIKFEGFNNSVVTLRCTSPMHENIFNSEYKTKFEEAFEEILGFKVQIVSVSDKIQKKTVDNNVTSEKNLNDYKNDQFTFDNFIVGPNNRFAYSAAKAVAADPASILSNGSSFSNYNPLFIYGNSGLGKTHILNAIDNEVKNKFPDMNIVYIRAEDFANEFYIAIQNKTTDEFHAKYRNNIDVFLIDDIQFISGKTQTEEEFFHTFDSLVCAGKQVVLTSDRPPKDIQSLTDRLKSRFEDGLLADVQPPEFETRCQIIKRKAMLLDLDIDDSVVEYIAEKIKANIRQLEGVTKKLYALSKISQHPVTIALAQNVIKEVMQDTQPTEVTIKHIVDEVSRTTGISIEDIYSEVRKANISKARKIAFFIVRKVTNLSYEDIGSEFNKHHSTVMYNIEQIEKEIEKDSKLSRQIYDIINNIKNVQ